MPLHGTTAAFWRQYNDLPSHIQLRAQQQFALLKSNPQHPSLHFKKLIEKDGEEIWSARVSLNYRVLAFKRQHAYLWFWIGDHQTYNSRIH